MAKGRSMYEIPISSNFNNMWMMVVKSCVFPAQNCHRSNSEFRTVLEAPMPYLYKCQIHSHLGG